MYADIALTVGYYAIDRYHPKMKQRLVDVAKMTIQRALVAKGEGPQPLRTFVTFDWKSNSAKCRFVSLDVSKTGKCLDNYTNSVIEIRQCHCRTRPLHDKF